MTGGRRINSGKSPGSRRTQFRPGVSGNVRPNNRQVLRNVAELKRIMHEEIGEEGWRKVVKKIYSEAMAGKEWACREIADRFLGKAVQHLDVEVDIAPVEHLPEMELLELLLQHRAPDHMWPPMMLERYRAGQLQLQGAKVVESKEVAG